MALTFPYRSATPPGPAPARVALLPGAWNPPTIAHLGVARAALAWAAEVVMILPRAFPHKAFEGPSFHDRLAMLGLLAASEPGLSVATSEGGLYREMAGEAAAYFGPATEIALVCGRDAAERIASWDYGAPGVFEDMLARYPLLVAARAGEYVPQPCHAHKILSLPLPASLSEVSSSEIRRRIAAGEPWRHLVPEAIAPLVASLYVP